MLRLPNHACRGGRILRIVMMASGISDRLTWCFVISDILSLHWCATPPKHRMNTAWVHLHKWASILLDKASYQLTRALNALTLSMGNSLELTVSNGDTYLYTSALYVFPCSGTVVRSVYIFLKVGGGWKHLITNSDFEAWSRHVPMEDKTMHYEPNDNAWQ